MFDLDQSIAEWRRELLRAGVKAPETLDELEEHLRERIATLQRGLDGADAFQTAVTQLGERVALRREFAKVKRPPFAFLRQNPPALNFVGLGLVLMGANCFLSEARVAAILQW